MNIRTHNEFVAFLDVMRNLGIQLQMCHQFDRHPWQEILYQEGYHVTHAALNGFQIGNMMFVFSTARPNWIVQMGKEFDQGEAGSFMFAYDMKTNQVIHRCHVSPDGGKLLSDAIGIQAMGKQQSFVPFTQ